MAFILRRRWVLAGALLGLAAVVWFFATRSAAARRLVGKHFGWPVPASVRDVRYRNTEWFGFVPEPAYYLRFSASSDDVQILLQRLSLGRAQAPPGPGFGPSTSPPPTGTPPWWRLDRASTNVELYARDKGKPCVIEWLWWDRSTHTVFYHVSCP